MFAPVLVAVGGGGEPPPNQAPTANFTFSTSGPTANFTDASQDTDGNLVAWIWSFGDGTPSTTLRSPSHTYAAAGTYSVTLTVTDDDGATGTVSRPVTVVADQPPPAVSLFLDVTLRKAGKNRFAELAWGGATAVNVEDFRRYNSGASSLLATTAHDGAYSDKLTTTTGTYEYKVCQTGSDGVEVCSNIDGVTL